MRDKHIRSVLLSLLTGGILTACNTVSPPASPSCEHTPLDENVAVQEWRGIGGVSSLKDVVALYGYDCSVQGLIQGYSLYGIPQERRDGEWLRLVKTLLDTGELSEETARRALVWFATEVQDDPAFEGGRWNMESTVFDAVVSAVNTFHLAKREGLIPVDQPLFLRDLTATWFFPSFASFSFSTPFTPFYEMAPEGYRAVGAPSLTALTEGNETFYAFFDLSSDTDGRIRWHAEMPGQGFDFLFYAPQPFPSPFGPDIFYPATLPGRVVSARSFPSPYVDNATEYVLEVSFAGLPWKIVPIPGLSFSFGHIVTAGGESPSQYLSEGVIIPPLKVGSDGSLSGFSWLGHTFKISGGTSNFDFIFSSTEYSVGYSLKGIGIDAWIIDPNVPVEFDWSSGVFGAVPRSFFSLDPRLRGIPYFDSQSGRGGLVYRDMAPPRVVLDPSRGSITVPGDYPDVRIILPVGVVPW